MRKRTINQFGEKPIYVERNLGNIYVGDYTEDAVSAFRNGSFDLYDYMPTISPAIPRAEVGQMKDWIEEDAAAKPANRVALLYGKAGIGKSVVMHDLLAEMSDNEDYLVLGLKSDQIEFVDTDDLGHKLRLAKPLDRVIREMAQKYKRVILLIDQIDALSLSLSSNRTPLRSLLRLIEQVKYTQHVRVVISCRPYDLEYDPQLGKLQIKHKWELKEFNNEQVSLILKENQCDERIGNRLMHFLGNPLHMYLFLKIKPQEPLTDPLSTDLLYHQLWSKYVTDDSERKVDKTQLLALLDSMVSTMYDRQELSVHIRAYETQYSAELKYLLTCGLLLMTRSGQVQFFHQTLFDYIYARRFTEKGNNLLEMLKAQHQGLFSRAAVKSILTFLREQTPVEYIRTIEQLLFAKDERGKETYRYHLQSLTLSNMAYFDTPLREELNLIARRVFEEKTYMNVIFGTVHTASWFSAIWNIIRSKGGWKTLTAEYKDEVMVMCKRTLWPDANIVLEELERSLDYHNEEDCKYIGDLLQYFNINGSSEKLIGFYNKLVKGRKPLEHVHLLKNILKDTPDFVCRELKENVKLQLAEKESRSFHRINYNHEEETLYEDMLEKHHDCGIQLLTDVLSLVYEATQYEIEGREILNSSEFSSFQRVRGGHFATNFIEDAANIIIDDFVKHLEEDRVKRSLADLSRSRHEGFVFIALYVYTQSPALFKNEIFDIIIGRQMLSNAPCWVEYQAVEALREAFPLWTEAQKKAIIARILEIDDRTERMIFGDDNVKMRLLWGHPILDIDLHKGKALEVIPMEELKRLSPAAYQERQRIDRKFKKSRLANEQPSSTSARVGWPSLTKEKGMKMSCKTWLNSMLKYNTDGHEWDRPSLTGQCKLFRTVVSSAPDKYLGLIDDAINHPTIALDYPLAGMQGLVDAGRYEEAENVLRKVLDVTGNDINSTARGFSAHSLLFAMDDMIKKGHVTDFVVQFLCNTLINAHEPTEDRHRDEKDVYNVGINQARGNAGYKLVECARYEKYGDDIFNAFEVIADTASVYTRSAILLNMAALNFIDKDRNVKLFKKLMHDYDTRLMAMPVHNYNPLVYFINYAVDELMDYFAHAAECADCYKSQVVILWLAWSHNEHDERIKVLLDKMCDNSEEARISLLDFLCTLDDRMDDVAARWIVHFMEDRYDSPKMGEACDNIFHHIEPWPDEIQHQIAQAFVSSKMPSYRIRSFISFLAGYAIKEPLEALSWLETVLEHHESDDYFIWNNIVDVLIQSYNGIRSFNDQNYRGILEHAMDLIDTIMQNPNNKYLISNFINKLDNE